MQIGIRRFGAIAAVAGAVISVAAGAGFGAIEGLKAPRAMLDTLSARPDWYWPLVHLGFVVGAVLWVVALIVLTDALEGTSRALATIAAGTVVLGAAMHLVDSGASGGGLTPLAGIWGAEGDPDTLAEATVLLQVLDGTWAMVVTFFHGVPFVLFGLALVLDTRHPSWLGWTAVLGGAGSIVVGGIMFTTSSDLYPAYVPFAVIDSVFMVGVGIRLWSADAPALEREKPERRTREAA